MENNTNSKFENLSKFAVNLNEKAAQGKLDPVIGRDEEIRRVLQILSRRTKNNPKDGHLRGHCPEDCRRSGPGEP